MNILELFQKLCEQLEDDNNTSGIIEMVEIEGVWIMKKQAREREPMKKNTSGTSGISTCGRCGENLRIQTRSWFTDDILGLKCIAKEDALKNTMCLLNMNPDEYKNCGREQYEKIKQTVNLK